MKILIVGHSLSGGGAEFVTREWMKFLHSSGDLVHVALLSNAEGTQMNFEPSGTYDLSDKTTPRLLNKIISLRKIIRQENFDVCLAIQTYPNLISIFATLFLKKKPRLVISERNVPSVLLPREGQSQRIQLRLAKLLYKFADAAIAISHPVAANLITSFKVRQSNCFVVPNPALAKVGIKEQQADRQISDGITLVLPFRLVPQKEPLKALQIAHVLVDKGYKVSILSFGLGSLSAAFQASASQQKLQLHVEGWQENWFDLCPENSVVLLPSFIEGFGNVLLEAAAVGIPSVAWSGALGVADAIIPGTTGVFSVGSSAENFAEAVLEAKDLKVDAPMGWLSYFSPESSGRIMRIVLSLVSTQS